MYAALLENQIAGCRGQAGPDFWLKDLVNRIVGSRSPRAKTTFCLYPHATTGAGVTFYNTPVMLTKMHLKRTLTTGTTDPYDYGR
jgi:hypothetical protein